MVLEQPRPSQGLDVFYEDLISRHISSASLLYPIFIFGVYLHGQKLTYFLRPLWESPPKPFQTLPHYYHENASMATLCSLHGWKHRESPRRVFDAVLFSNEVDMLTIRWKELYPYITQGYGGLERLKRCQRRNGRGRARGSETLVKKRRERRGSKIKQRL